MHSDGFFLQINGTNTIPQIHSSVLLYTFRFLNTCKQKEIHNYRKNTSHYSFLIQCLYQNIMLKMHYKNSTYLNL